MMRPDPRSKNEVALRMGHPIHGAFVKLTGKDTDSVCHPEAGTGQEEPF